MDGIGRARDENKVSTIGRRFFARNRRAAIGASFFAAEYDGNQKVSLKGSIVKVEWMNPHIWIYIDAKDDSGKTVRWQCEGGPPNCVDALGLDQGCAEGR